MALPSIIDSYQKIGRLSALMTIFRDISNDFSVSIGGFKLDFKDKFYLLVDTGNQFQFVDEFPRPRRRWWKRSRWR